MKRGGSCLFFFLIVRVLRIMSQENVIQRPPDPQAQIAGLGP
jgi:hypothetical protein